MHPSTTTSLLLLLVGCAASSVAADGGYYDSCKDQQLDHRNNQLWLSATCDRDHNFKYPLAVDFVLDQCFGNSDGQLVGQDMGGFSPSCKDFKRKTSVLHATCLNRAGEEVDTEIDMNEWIQNRNGVLTCFNHD